MKAYLHCPGPIGALGLVEEDGCIVRLLFDGVAPPDGCVREDTPLLRAAAQQLAEYFARRRTQFDLPLAPQGTAFQRAVWEALCAIPSGETRTYGQLAAQLGRAKAARAVGMANNRNPLPIFIPCHRVIGADGSLTGYAGGLEAKRALLELERRDG